MLSKAIVATLFIGLPVNAMGEPEEKKHPKASAQERQAISSNTQAPITPPQGKIKNLKDFIPSEKISADRPVSFPADI